MRRYTFMLIGVFILLPAASECYRFMGCYRETQFVQKKPSGHRLLQGDFITFTGSLTPELCINHCKAKNFHYAGLQNKNQCFCSNERPAFKYGADIGECNSKCDGDESKMCGGNWRLSVYDIQNQRFNYVQSNYIGCYADDGENKRALRGKIPPESTYMTPEFCVGYCFSYGYKYAGVQNSNQCFCGDEIEGEHVREDECHMDCTGDPRLYCGGAWRSNIYHTSITDESEEGRFLGCYVDSNLRLLSEYYAVMGKTNTPRRCLSVCRAAGFDYAGMEAGFECYCSNKRPVFKNATDMVECDMKCSGDKSKICGGLWRLSVYGKQDEGNNYVRSNYIGCYSDDGKNKGALNGMASTESSHMTPEFCLGYCFTYGYKYGGVQNSKQCFCGDKIQGKEVSGTECNMECSGDHRLHCGGAGKSEIYFTSILDEHEDRCFVGCFIHTDPVSLLSGYYTMNHQTNTPKRCINLCKIAGFNYAGVEAGFECRCDNKRPDLDKEVGENECQKPCPRNKLKTCGAGWRLKIYSTLSSCISSEGNVYPGECSEKNEFTCDSGQCIKKTQLCDGSKECYDESDESIAHCISHTCPANSFQCSYGGCISIGKKCNGNVDCKDGSDEDSDACGSSPGPPRPSTPHHGTELLHSCPLPDKPNGGVYEVLGCTAGDRSPICEKIPGTLVKQYSIIEFSCSDGFALPGSINISYCQDGKWIPPPAECKKLCPPLKSDSVDLWCYYLNSPINCTGIIKPRTVLKAKCKQLFHSDADPLTSFTETVCQSDGTWANQLFSCKPECGIKKSVKPLIFNAPETDSEYPWHASLYRKSGQEYICGGTIINDKIILTAAHCVVEFIGTRKTIIPSDDFRVAVAKFRRSWSVKDPHEQRFEVTEIIPHGRYVGRNNRYDNDIAVLVLSGKIIIKPTVMPVCVDWGKDYYYLVKAGAIGTVLGWGSTGSGPSEKLRVARLPYFDFDRCREEVPRGFSAYITSDKFCAGLHNGTYLGGGDSGGGFTFQKVTNNEEVHYLYGIVSVTDPDKPDIAAFTNVTYHFEWLKNVIVAVQKTRRE